MNAMLFLTMLLASAAVGGGRPPADGGAIAIAGGPATRSAEDGEADRPRSHVRVIQQALSDRGFDPGSIDGIMGASTSSALRRYQRSERLPVTGEMDVDTVERLRAAGRDTQMTR